MEVAIINIVLGRRAGVLELVFVLLPLRDMKNVVLVCHLWREAGEAPSFWTWVRMTVTGENMSTMPERLDSRRMRAVREVRMKWRVEVSEEVMEAVARHPGLRLVEMCGANLSSVDAGLLVRVVDKLEEVSFLDTELTGKQVEAVMAAIRAEGCLVKKLNISFNNLSTVEPRLLASLVNRLEEVRMYRTQLTVKQVEAVLTQSLVKTSLRKLVMEGNEENSELDEDLVARARLAIGELEL